MNARFYAPDARDEGTAVLLPPEEARHLTRVLQLAPGDPVRVFDGRGAEFDAVVDVAGRDGASVRLGARREAAAEARVAITLAQAVLKGDKMDGVVRDAVMMGVAAIQPVVATRSEIARAALVRGDRRARWQRIAVSSAKQCGRAVVPRVLEPAAFLQVLESISGMSLPSPAVMFVEPGAAPGALPASEIDAYPPKEATVVVGPEGGWTPREIDDAAASCRFVTLGGRTLRGDVMAVVALTALFTRWREF